MNVNAESTAVFLILTKTTSFQATKQNKEEAARKVLWCAVETMNLSVICAICIFWHISSEDASLVSKIEGAPLQRDVMASLPTNSMPIERNCSDVPGRRHYMVRRWNAGKVRINIFSCFIFFLRIFRNRPVVTAGLFWPPYCVLPNSLIHALQLFFRRGILNAQNTWCLFFCIYYC